MNLQEMKKISKDYIGWLESNFIVFEDNNSQAISTPFLDPFNDGIEVYLDHSNKQILLHDGGRTIDNLLDLGVQLDKSERRKSIIDHALAGSGVVLKNNRLEITIGDGNYSQRLHFLITAILRLNDLWMTSIPRSSTDFFEIVKEYFDSNEILYTANKSIPGQTVEHRIDFIIPLPKGRDRLVMLISKPDLQAAKISAFTWLDLTAVSSNSEKFIIINDLDSSNENNSYNTKHVNENALSILKGYSDKQFFWSQAINDPNFANSMRTLN